MKLEIKRQKNVVWKLTEKNRERLKGYISKQGGVNEQFERKINQDMRGNRKLLQKEVSNVKGEKEESCSRIKDGNERMKCAGFGRSILKICII